jgi:plasmid maintenance system antidote protein VapI
MTGGQLQRLLDRAGLSQRGAAKALGINERTMRKYVAGDAEIPRAIEIAIRCLAEHSGNQGAKQS